jgi:hypothetical protein
MTNEFIFGSFTDAVKFAKRHHWCPAGRAAWISSDRQTCVHFLTLEHLEGISKGERVYVVGKLKATALYRLAKVGAVIVK